MIPRFPRSRASRILVTGCLSVCTVVTPVTVHAQLPLGPRLPRSRQSFASTDAPAAINTFRADSGHVRPNHWKRGAIIGLVATAVPTAIVLLAHRRRPGECGPFSNSTCATVSWAVILSVGGLGALVGGFVGSFFPRTTTGP